MDFRTIVDIPRPPFAIGALEDMLFVGSCFADNIGKRFVEEKFHAVVNPYGVMYNPASILHTISRYVAQRGATLPSTAFFTLGTSHVYRLKETGEIVDNCRKRPQRLFQEEVLGVDACRHYLQEAVDMLASLNPEVRVVVTVSPIRYAKYGYHGSQLSKSTLLLAADALVRGNSRCAYFPAYEIVQDELRDYRFYQPDMTHPSEQAVDYIYERFCEAYLSSEAKEFLREWRPIKAALAHRPFNPSSAEYQAFMEETRRKADRLEARYPGLKI